MEKDQTVILYYNAALYENISTFIDKPVSGQRNINKIPVHKFSK